MTRPTGAYRLFDFAGSTRKSLRFFEEHADEFDEFVEAFAFFEEHDAILYGFFDVQPSEPKDNPRFRWPAVPRLILRDRQGAEVWLGGCNCGYGGEGPSGSQEVLRASKFPERLVELIPPYRILHLDKRRGVIEARKPSSEDARRPATVSGRAPIWRSEIWIVDGTPTLLLGRVRTDELLEQWQVQGVEWMPDPVAADLYLDDDAAATADLRYPVAQAWDHYPPIYNLAIRDASGRELWLYVPIVVDRLLDADGVEEAGALLAACGFDLAADVGSFRRRIRTTWRARQDPVLHFRRAPSH
jgi:hypothetical protein